jgi:hypothetical protein
MNNSRLTYQLPRVLLAQAREEMASIPNAELFNNSAHQKLREKWCAGMLGLGYELGAAPCLVAVNESQDNLDVDIYLLSNGLEFPFQLVEAMEPGRRRGQEYKRVESINLQGISSSSLEEGHKNGPRWITEKIKQKVEKHYEASTKLNLLVYANFSARQLEYEDVCTAARPYLSSFSSVWVVSSLFLGALSITNELKKVNGWCQIFTPEQYASNDAG